MQDDWVTVVPGPGEVKDTARALLALARSPHDVLTTVGGTQFRIPPYLADLYNTPPAPKRRRPKKEEVTSNGNDLRESGTREADASDASG